MARRLLLAALLALPAPAAATTLRAGAPADAERCSTVAGCRADLARARRAIAWQIRTRHRVEARLRYRWRPTVHYAIALASRAFRVDQAAMLRVAACESTLDPTATNGRYAGLFQTGPSFWAATPFASFSRFDPVANALAAASVVRYQGWRQWECQP